MGRRIEEIDFLKCVLITLMVVFHLRYIGDKYADIKEIVYAFHMPGFLIISGFFANTWQKGATRRERAKRFFRKIKYLLVPYVIMETGYVCMSAFLPVRDGVESLSLQVLATKLLLHPLGPYWYLHTLIICSAALFLAFQPEKSGKAGNLLACALFLFLLVACGLVAPSGAFYFFAGAAVGQYQQDFLKVFRPRAFMILPFLALCVAPIPLNRFSPVGVAVTFFAITAIMGLLRFLKGNVRAFCLFVGRNSLSVLLFSPIFTMAAKSFLKFFSFDPTGICFMAVATVLAIGGSLLITRLMDISGLSVRFFGKEKALS